jgi:hypothetical protein
MVGKFFGKSFYLSKTCHVSGTCSFFFPSFRQARVDDDSLTVDLFAIFGGENGLGK